MKLTIFSDLDGTLLDRDTYLPGPALEALAKCRFLEIPVNLVSGKTRAEMEDIRQGLGLETPFISENGGGLYIPDGYFKDISGGVSIDGYHCFRSPERIKEIRQALEEIALQAEIEVKAFYQLTPEEISDLTGLTFLQAEKARLREFDEPFLIIDNSPDKTETIKSAIARHGLRYNYGGYLHHITGNFDKGQRAEQLKGLYLKQFPEIKFAAVGDAFNDLPMLRVADHPYLVRRNDGSFDESLYFERLTITREIGPAGFVEAIDTLINDYHFDG